MIGDARSAEAASDLVKKSRKTRPAALGLDLFVPFELVFFPSRFAQAGLGVFQRLFSDLHIVVITLLLWTAAGVFAIASLRREPGSGARNRAIIINQSTSQRRALYRDAAGALNGPNG